MFSQSEYMLVEKHISGYSHETPYCWKTY